MAPSSKNYYEVLGIPTTASPEHVERAYRYHVGLYSESALATYSLLDPLEKQQARAQIQEAYDVLKDPLRRRAYDVSQGIASIMAETVVPGAPPSGPPLSKLRDPVTGGALRRVREELGIPLEEIAQKSRVGLRYLQYIEADRHTDLPARVYLRGFLMEYARALGLDAAHTADAYLAAMTRK